jgi:hypothetical protein
VHPGVCLHLLQPEGRFFTHDAGFSIVRVLIFFFFFFFLFRIFAASGLACNKKPEARCNRAPCKLSGR